MRTADSLLEQQHRIGVHRIPEMGRSSVDSNAAFIDGLEVPEADRTGEQDRGLRCMLDSLDPEHIPSVPRPSASARKPAGPP